MKKTELRTPGRLPQSQRGAGLVETVVAMPTLLLFVLSIWQAALAYEAKSSVNYATFEAARAGSVKNADVGSIKAAFRRAMVGYYGGGTTLAELAKADGRALLDLTPAALRVEVLSPTQESFKDYASPELKTAMKSGEPVIPNVGLDELTCPRDVPGCKSDPKANESGQTLLDANLLKLRITYGIPKEKQMPMVGRVYTWALNKLGAGAGDAFKQALIEEGRIPIVSHVVVRMQSDAIRNAAMASIPGSGNQGTPVEPSPPASSPELPSCPWWDPSCSICTEGAGKGKCEELPPPTCNGTGG